MIKEDRGRCCVYTGQEKGKKVDSLDDKLNAELTQGKKRRESRYFRGPFN